MKHSCSLKVGLLHIKVVLVKIYPRMDLFNIKIETVYSVIHFTVALVALVPDIVWLYITVDNVVLNIHYITTKCTMWRVLINCIYIKRLTSKKLHQKLPTFFWLFVFLLSIVQSYNYNYQIVNNWKNWWLILSCKNKKAIVNPTK